MAVQIQNLNIPNLTVNDMVNELSELYGSAVAQGIPFRRLLTPFLWGPPGVGKSQGIFQLAERLEAQTGKRVTVTDVRLLLYQPVDLRGIPIPDADRKTSVWLRPKIFDMDPDDGVINLLFLDELSAVPSSIQAAAYQICLDRRIGEHELPENCIVIAAGNRQTDQSVTFKMPKALCNRLMHYNIVSNFEAWKNWAVNHGISGLVIGFLNMNNSRLCDSPESQDLAFCTPRTWEGVSTALEVLGKSPERAYRHIAACVGSDTALEFESFCTGALEMPDVGQIFSGTCYERPAKHSVIFALIGALTSAISNSADTIGLTELNNVCEYVSKLPRDFSALFLHDLRLVEGLDSKLAKCPAVNKMVTKYGV